MRTWKSTVLSVAAAGILVTGMRAADLERSLFERLGGMPAIQAVAGDMVDRILTDQRVNQWFTHAASSPENTAAYKSTLATFLCQSTGGPCKYVGPDMTSVHQGRGITGEAFHAVVEDLIGSLEKFKVPEKEKGQLLAMLGPLKTSIVQK